MSLSEQPIIILGSFSSIEIPMMCSGNIMPKQKVQKILGVEFQAAIYVFDAPCKA